MKRRAASDEKPDFRKSSRIELVTPVEIRAGTSHTIGLTENISPGGLLLQCSPDFQSGARIAVLFNLTAGLSIKASCSLAHVQAGSRIGLRFLNLEDPYRKTLEGFIREIAHQTQPWQEKVIVKRLHVIVRGLPPTSEQEAMAETLLLSRRGGVLLCRAQFRPGDGIFLWSPDRKLGAHAKIVSYKTKGADGLVELGFEIQDTHDLWGTDILRTLSPAVNLV